MTYDGNNIFAKILRGEIPCHRVYEDQHTLAFMDVMPMVDGHCLVITKSPARNILDVEPVALSHVMATVQKIARAAKKAFNADGIQIRQYNEEAGGQTVFHLHFHVLPMKAGVSMRPHTGKMAEHGILAEHSDLLKKNLGF